jgi:peroxiredoxin
MIRYVLAAILLLAPLSVGAQQKKIVWSGQEQPIVTALRGLRGLPDDVRAKTTKQLALDIRGLPTTPNKLTLAKELANLSTEGDFGHDTLQEVATTLADALREQPDQPEDPYLELATLVRYEHVNASLDNPKFDAAMSKLEAQDRQREHADFTLTDLQGKAWTLQNLKGKVVLVNFWATWCPPCRKEMPDLDALYQKFKDRGLIVLAISDEDAAKVRSYIQEHKVSYPILLDPGRKVNEEFQVEGIPKSFVYDCNGKLAAQAIDMRTKQQFLEMLESAGLNLSDRKEATQTASHD